MVKFYNSLTRTKEEVPAHDGNVVKMYSCGPTVYSYPHIGNFRAYIFMDSLRRMLESDVCSNIMVTKWTV